MGPAAIGHRRHAARHLPACLGLLLPVFGCQWAGPPSPASQASPFPQVEWFLRIPPSPLPNVSLSTAGDASRRETFRGKYTFTEAWFGNDFPAWERALTPYRGRPGLRYLEVGVFEGGSVLWMLENVLTDPGSRATVIDPLEGDLKSRFLSNLEKSGEERKVDVIVGFSQIELRKLPLAAYDVVYIDGSHTADDVLEDAVLAWRLVKPGGLLIFDDYEWAGWRTPEPPARTPRPALTAFYTLYGRHFDAVHVGYRLILRRREPGP